MNRDRKISASLWLVALVLAVAAPRLPADIVLNSRLSNAGALANAGSNEDRPPLVQQTDFLPADLSAAAAATQDDASASSSASLHSDITLDTVAGTLRLTGDGTTTGDSTFGSTMMLASNTEANVTVLVLDFTLTDVSYTYTLTGQVSSTIDDGQFNGFGNASLRTSSTTIFYVVAVSDADGGESKPLSENGTLPPGTYSFSVLAGGGAPAPFSELPHSKGNANANFVLMLVPVGAPTPTPTPTPTPIQWNNSAGGSFHTATNWDPQMVPGANDTAVFGLASAYSVDVGTATTERLEIRNGDVTFTNATYTVAATAFDPAGILLDNAKLTLASLSVLNGVHALIGESAAARVDVITGGLNLSGSLRVGGPGNGILDITDVGTVLSGEGRIGNGVGGGTVTVTGTDATWSSGNLAVGYSGNGTLTISDGAGVTSEEGFVGFEAGSDGFVEVEGDLSNWTLNGTLTIGEGGVGVLSVLDGALVTCPNMNLGNSAGGTAIVKGVGTEPSLVDVVNDITVGSGNSGILDVQDGAVVRATGNITIGFGSSAVGSINLVGKSTAGPSLLSSLGDITVGFAGGEGFLKIQEDASVISDTALIGLGEGIGRVELGVDNAPGNPASWSVSDQMFVGSSGSATGTGTVVLHNGAIVTVGQVLEIGNTGSICGNGTYSVMGVENNGTVCPGNSAGTLVIDGAYTQTSSGKLLMEIAGPDPGQFDVLHVTGASVLDGTMEIRMLGNFLPAAGQTFDLLQLDGSVSGDFAQITFPDLKPGFQFSAEQSGGVFRITALNNGVAANALLNISTRTQVGTGDNVLIAGFIVQGNEPKKVILRGIGPSLPMDGRITNPILELRGSGGLIFSNDDWMDSPQRQQIIDSTIPPTNDLESAIVATLYPGAYTTILGGANGATGIGLVEVYDLAQDASVNMVNISTRGSVQTGDDVMIAGFIATGTTRIITRALGPSLTSQGVAGALADPTLEVVDANGMTLQANDNWRDSQQDEISGTTIPPPDDLEAAVVVTLQSGPYTIIVRGANGTSGVGLVEVYKL